MPADIEIPRVEHADIVIDGKVDQDEWARAAALGDFVTFDPIAGNPPKGACQARVLADDRAFYVLFEVTDPEPERIRATLGRRDSRFDDDFVGLQFDPGGEGQRATVFIVNPLGLQMDGVTTADGGEDFSWDTRWQSVGQVGEQGYTVELAIPWDSVRHERQVDQTGIIVFRKRSADNVKSSWPTLDPNVQGLLVQHAKLRGPGSLDRTVGLSLAPSLTFGWTDTGPDASRWGYQGLAPGITGQWMPTPADSVMLTINPDFSQVESDGAQVAVNRRYALYLDEKRPFFLEGQEWFETPLDGLLYTRSMGAPRTGLRATSARGGWAVAALNVLDHRPLPTVSEGGGWSEADLDGRDALSTLLRARGPMGADGYFGALFSDRTVLGTDLANRLGGADARLRLSDGLVAEAAGFASHTTMADGSALTGPAGAASFDYQSEHFWVDTEAQYLSPGFRAENGFIPQSDRLGSWVESGYSLYPDGKVFRRVNLLPVDVYAYWYTTGEVREFIAEPDVNWTWSNGMFTFLEYQYNNELYADQWFTMHRGEGGGGGQVNKWLGFYVFGGAGEGLLYDATDPRPGLSGWVAFSPTLQPVHWLGLESSLVAERFLENDGTIVYTGWTGRFKLEAYASARLWARLIYDHDKFAESSNAEALLAYELAPGRVFYLGAGSALGDETRWGLFAKGAWVFTM